jgi:hypothetical protein
VGALEEAAANARSRQIPYESVVNHNYALKRRAINAGWIAVAIVVTMGFWLGFLFNPKGNLGGFCCLGVLLAPLVGVVSALAFYAANRQGPSERL